MGSEPPEHLPHPILPRSAVILVILGGATLAAFGLAAVRGVFTPAFLAFVLTLCVHPLRQWLQGHGVPRGIATAGTITAVFAMLACFAGILIAALAQFSALLPQFAPQLAQAGTSIAGWLSAVGFGPEQVQAVQEGFKPDGWSGLSAGCWATSVTWQPPSSLF